MLAPAGVNKLRLEFPIFFDADDIRIREWLGEEVIRFNPYEVPAGNAS